MCDAGAAQSRRRSAGARARLSAVDGGGGLAGGTPRHYVCDEANDWNPDLNDMRSKITPNTRAIVVINPNNPTGAVYSDEILKEIIQIAREHNLIIFADEIYDKMLYDGVTHTSIASLADDVLFVTLQRLVQELPRLRLPLRLDGRVRREKDMRRIIWTA